MHYMRKDEEYPPERLDAFLKEYIASPELRAAWKIDAAPTAFTREFQERLNQVTDQNPLPPPVSPGGSL